MFPKLLRMVSSSEAHEWFSSCKGFTLEISNSSDIRKRLNKESNYEQDFERGFIFACKIYDF